MNKRANYDYVVTGARTVMVTSGGLERFADIFPCSGMHFDDDIAVEFEFAGNGDLVEVSWFDCTEGHNLDISEPDGVNGEALLALSHDAGAFLKAEWEASVVSSVSWHVPIKPSK